MPLFFCGGGLPIFVLRSKQMDMLNGITLGQFSVFIMVVVCIYYLYVLLTYYRAEVLGWLTRKGGNDKKGGEAAGNKQGPSGEPEPGELFGQKGHDIASSGEERFQQMQRAIAVLRQVIMQGIENKLDRGNLLDHIHEVLKEHRQLQKTEYAETINNFLIRVCSSELGLELGEAELAELWK